MHAAMSDANEPTSSDGGSSTNQQQEPSDPEPSFIQRAYQWVRRKVYPRRIRAIALGLNNCGKTTLLNHLQTGEPQYRVFIPTVVAQVYDVEYKDAVFQVRVVQRHSSHLPSVRCRGPAHLPPTCRIRARTVYWLCQSCVLVAPYRPIGRPLACHWVLQFVDTCGYLSKAAVWQDYMCSMDAVIFVIDATER